MRCCASAVARNGYATATPLSIVPGRAARSSRQLCARPGPTTSSGAHDTDLSAKRIADQEDEIARLMELHAELANSASTLLP